MPRYRVIYDPSPFSCEATNCDSPGSSHTLRSPEGDVLAHSCPTHAWILQSKAQDLNFKEKP